MSDYKTQNLGNLKKKELVMSSLRMLSLDIVRRARNIRKSIFVYFSKHIMKKIVSYLNNTKFLENASIIWIK